MGACLILLLMLLGPVCLSQLIFLNPPPRLTRVRARVWNLEPAPDVILEPPRLCLSRGERDVRCCVRCRRHGVFSPTGASAARPHVCQFSQCRCGCGPDWKE